MITVVCSCFCLFVSFCISLSLFQYLVLVILHVFVVVGNPISSHLSCLSGCFANFVSVCGNFNHFPATNVNSYIRQNPHAPTVWARDRCRDQLTELYVLRPLRCVLRLLSAAECIKSHSWTLILINY